MSSKSELETLRYIINESLDVLQAELKAANMPELFLEKPERHPLDDTSSDFMPSTKMYEARRTLLAATRMMGAIVQSPTERLLEEGWGHQRCSALQAAIQYKVAEELADASVDPEKGVSGAELAKKFGLNADPFTRVMRMLSAHHYFRETSEGHFANNRISLGFIPPNAAPLAVLFTSGFGLTTAGRMVDALSTKEPLSASQLAFNYDTDLFTWLEKNPKYLKIFTHAMTGCYDAASTGLVMDFPWSSYPEGTVIVDIGGGEGGLGMAIVRAHKNLHLINQDRPELQEAAHINWEKGVPTAFKEGRIKYESYNFFTPQPRSGDQYVYTMRCVIHDWPFDECVQILNNLKSAMTPASRLLIIEHVIYPPITSNKKTPLALNTVDNSAPYKELDTPWPLPFGSQILELTTDYEMFSNFKTAKERTPAEFDDLTKAVGMKVVNIWPTRTEFSIVEISLA